MRLKHYFRFSGDIAEDINYGQQLDQAMWNKLRNSPENAAFALEESVDEYEDNCRKQTDYEQIAKIICNYMQDLGGVKCVSLGCGKAILEWHMEQIMPEMKIDCTDYTEQIFDQLRNCLKKINKIFYFDMLQDDYTCLRGYDFVIMCRMSTEFNINVWKKIFQRMSASGIKRIIFIPTEIANRKLIVEEWLDHMKQVIKKRKDIWCGWMYTENEFYKMWGKYYEVEKVEYQVNTGIFFLKIK